MLLDRAAEFHHPRDTTTMPTYAYRGQKCGESFERIETISEHGASKPTCPKCGSDDIAYVPAPFYAKTSKKSARPSVGRGAGDGPAQGRRAPRSWPTRMR